MCTKVSPHQGEVQEALTWAREQVKIIEKDREGRERLERQARERKEKEKLKEQEKKNDGWKFQHGDGDWHDGKGGGRGNKRGGGYKKTSAGDSKKVPRGLYDILELKPSCLKAEIKKAYHRLSLKAAISQKFSNTYSDFIEEIHPGIDF